MIVDSTIVPGGISFTKGHVESVKFRKNPVLQFFFFKTRYNRNIKLSMMYKITQLWPFSTLLPPLCQISHLFLRIFCQKSRPYRQYIPIRPYRVVLPWVIFKNLNLKHFAGLKQFFDISIAVLNLTINLKEKKFYILLRQV